jgi:hypothetical protein
MRSARKRRFSGECDVVSRILSSVVAVLALALAGCSSVAPEAYRGEKPELDLARYFNGTVDGWGMVQDRSGKVLRRFYVRIEGSWQGNVGTLDESFDWSDGEREKRVWTVTKLDGGRYTGRAADVVGEANGAAAGHALQWGYTLQLPAKQGGWQVSLDDWMYLVDEDTMINRAVISKFGIRFGDITIAFRKRKS